MSKFTDQAGPTIDQYRDPSKLDARLATHPRLGTNPHGWVNWIIDTLVRNPGPVKSLQQETSRLFEAVK